MNCQACNTNIDKGWGFCPKCGTHLRRRDPFNELFNRVFDEFRGMNKVFERDIEAMDISPWFKQPKKSGFSVKVVSTGNKPPKVFVQTYGDVDKNQVQKQVLNELGIQNTIQEQPVSQKQPEKEFKAPKTTEEPKADIRRIGDKVLVDIQLPGALGKDIHINELDSSIEVKAIVGEKAYFKILTKPGDYHLLDKKFGNGILRLEFA